MRPARRQPRHGHTGSRRRKSPPWPRRARHRERSATVGSRCWCCP